VGERIWPYTKKDEVSGGKGGDGRSCVYAKVGKFMSKEIWNGDSLICKSKQSKGPFVP